MSAPDAPALRPDGTLKEASELEWIHSPSAENSVVLARLGLKAVSKAWLFAASAFQN